MFLKLFICDLHLHGSCFFPSLHSIEWTTQNPSQSSLITPGESLRPRTFGLVVAISNSKLDIYSLHSSWVTICGIDLVKIGRHALGVTVTALTGAPTSSTARALTLTQLFPSLTGRLVIGFPTICLKVATTTVSLAPSNRSSSARSFPNPSFLRAVVKHNSHCLFRTPSTVDSCQRCFYWHIRVRCCWIERRC